MREYEAFESVIRLGFGFATIASVFRATPEHSTS